MSSRTITACLGLAALLGLPRCFDLNAMARSGAEPYIQAFNRHDASTMTGSFSESFVFVDPSGHRFVGRDAVRAYFEKLFAKAPDLKIELVDIDVSLGSPARNVANWRVIAGGKTIALHSVDVAQGGVFVESTWTSPSAQLFDVSDVPSAPARGDTPAAPATPARAGAIGIQFATAEDASPRVVGVAPGSPAATAGITAGDIVQTVDGVPVATVGDVVRRSRGLKPGQHVQFGVDRNGTHQGFDLTVGDWGAPWARQAVASATQTLPSLVSAAPQPGAFALIVGIEHYRDVPAATGARSDAERFAQVARQTLGLKDEHVRVATEDHATRSDILGGLKWLNDSVSAGSRIYFFFSGHGAPSPDSSTYLLPYDGNPKDVAGSAIAMSDVMASLGQTKAKEVLAVVDSCFSGAGGRSVLPPGARPLMRVKEAAPTAQLALFTASQGDEISGPAPGENAGVFTKYVTTGLGTGAADANGDGQISLQELSDWVTPRVARAAKQDNRDQHPKLVVGSGVGDPGNFIVEYGLATK